MVTIEIAGPELGSQVEQLVDAASLEQVLEALGCMCTEKEMHLLEEGDVRISRPWARAATKLQRLANTLDI